MDSYLTTYRKDYRWPVVPPREFATLHESNVLENRLDACCKEIISAKVTKPETHQIQLSSIPSAANKENQPDGFLGQLYDSYPYLYTIQKGPKEDIQRKNFRKRFITTYQNDYCKKEDYDPEPKEESSEEKSAICRKSSKEHLKEQTFLSKLRKPAPKLRVTEPTKEGSGDKEAKGPGVPKRLQKKPVSEYTDSIGKTGIVIVQRKLLKRKPR